MWSVLRGPGGQNVAAVSLHLLSHLLYTIRDHTCAAGWINMTLTHTHWDLVITVFLSSHDCVPTVDKMCMNLNTFATFLVQDHHHNLTCILAYTVRYSVSKLLLSPLHIWKQPNCVSVKTDLEIYVHPATNVLLRSLAHRQPIHYYGIANVHIHGGFATVTR